MSMEHIRRRYGMHDPLNDELYEDDLDPDEDAEHDDDEHQ